MRREEASAAAEGGSCGLRRGRRTLVTRARGGGRQEELNAVKVDKDNIRARSTTLQEEVVARDQHISKLDLQIAALTPQAPPCPPRPLRHHPAPPDPSGTTLPRQTPPLPRPPTLAP